VRLWVTMRQICAICRKKGFIENIRIILIGRKPIKALKIACDKNEIILLYIKTVTERTFRNEISGS
jgi:hypothetical protein